MKYISSIESINRKEKNGTKEVIINGWFVSNADKPVTFMSKLGEREIPCRARSIKRSDVTGLYSGISQNDEVGYELVLLEDNTIDISQLNIYACTENETIQICKNGKTPSSEKRKRFFLKIKRMFKALNLNNFKRFFKYFIKHGFKGMKQKIASNLKKDEYEYDRWFKRNRITEEELVRQRSETFSYAPKFSILVPTYNTPEVFLRNMIDSVLNQTYPNVELCLADASTNNQKVRDLIKEYASTDERVRYVFLEENKGISENTNGALRIATGEYIGLLDHDDALEPDALYEVVKALQEQPYSIVYTDEDKSNGDMTVFMDPNFKPDFSMDLFRSHNYITHFFVVRKEIVDKVGGFQSEYDGAQDYDLMFRCIEQAKSIRHVSKILYHWRMHGGSTAENPESKLYAYEAGRKALQAHLDRVGDKAVTEHTDMWGMYHTIYDTKDNPLISIIIANKDHIKDLDKCIQSILKKSSYQNYEIIIVENNSTEKKTFEYYEMIQKQHENIHVVKWDGIFNYSAINNFGVRHSKGDYILLLNNDTELISPDGLSDMLGICMRKEVGIVGARLLFGDDTVQHAGIVLGFGGFAGHVFTGIDRNQFGYMVRARINCNYNAVTAACLMTKRSVWDEVDGLDESFVVALNDVDFCLRVRQKDYLVVYDAFAEWYHYESKSRGYEDTPEKIKRFEGEVERFQNRWDAVLKAGDRYYNDNFSVDAAPFTLKG